VFEILGLSPSGILTPEYRTAESYAYHLANSQ